MEARSSWRRSRDTLPPIHPVTTEGGFSHGEPTTLVRHLGSLAAYTIATPDHSRMSSRVSPDAAQDKGEMRLLFRWQDGVRQRNP